MGVDAVWKTEAGQELGRLGDPGMILSGFVSDERRVAGTVCLRFIDAYGDACFNQLQLPVLVEELSAAAQAEGEPELRDHLEALAAFARGSSEMHTYVWFIGD